MAISVTSCSTGVHLYYQPYIDAVAGAGQSVPGSFAAASSARGE
jgi:hypothetical protein